MTSLTDRLRQHAELHQQCTVQDAEQKTFADDLLAAADEIERATHQAREIGPLMQRAADVAGERAANAILTAEIDTLRYERDLLRIVVEGTAAADELLETPEAIFRLARIARDALGETK